MIRLSYEQLVELTQLNPYKRFSDGRPCVPKELLEAVKEVSIEHAWKVLKDHGYRRQYAGSWIETNPGKVIAGRATTAQFLPHRPDFDAYVALNGEREGRPPTGYQNSWVIEDLIQDDLMVVDIFGKIADGTVIGDNLGTAIRTRTGVGAIIDGGMRDYRGLTKFSDVNFFARGVHPSAIAGVTLAGVNIPVRVGEATVLPGDVVLATPSGMIAIPPHLVEEVVQTARETDLRDEFGKLRLSESKYGSGEIDEPVWSGTLEQDFQEWRRGQDDVTSKL